jgi:hypothetical protein
MWFDSTNTIQLYYPQRNAIYIYVCVCVCTDVYIMCVYTYMYEPLISTFHRVHIISFELANVNNSIVVTNVVIYFYLHERFTILYIGIRCAYVVITMISIECEKFAIYTRNEFFSVGSLFYYYYFFFFFYHQ